MMAQDQHHFITHWEIAGPPAKVYQILRDGKNYHRWWPQYRRCEEVSPRQLQVTVKALLPYTLTFCTELVTENPPHTLIFTASGDLVGTGRWELQASGEKTLVDFYWDVSVRKFFLRWLSPLLKPLLVWNHDGVMRAGEKALQKWVDRS